MLVEMFSLLSRSLNRDPSERTDYCDQIADTMMKLKIIWTGQQSDSIWTI